VGDTEDWAEIRRLHRGGADADQGDYEGAGLFDEHGDCGLLAGHQRAVRATTIGSEQSILGRETAIQPYRMMEAKTTQNVNSPRPRIVTASGRP
jgi:hypothetical protein